MHYFTLSPVIRISVVYLLKHLKTELRLFLNVTNQEGIH